jgi:hypothetical protein
MVGCCWSCHYDYDLRSPAEEWEMDQDSATRGKEKVIRPDPILPEVPTPTRGANAVIPSGCDMLVGLLSQSDEPSTSFIFHRSLSRIDSDTTMIRSDKHGQEREDCLFSSGLNQCIFERNGLTKMTTKMGRHTRKRNLNRMITSP